MSDRQLTRKQREAIKWVKALRSGKYKQIFGKFNDRNRGACAIGVLLAENGMIDETWVPVEQIFGQVLLAEVMFRNDRLLDSFETIADYIEKKVLANVHADVRL